MGSRRGQTTHQLCNFGEIMLYLWASAFSTVKMKEVGVMTSKVSSVTKIADYKSGS